MSGIQKIQKTMVPPIKRIFEFLQSKATVQIWLYEQLHTLLEGKIIGFDEFMNIVLDEAVEVNSKKDTRVELGRILLKGENVTMIVKAP